MPELNQEELQQQDDVAMDENVNNENQGPELGEENLAEQNDNLVSEEAKAISEANRNHLDQAEFQKQLARDLMADEFPEMSQEEIDAQLERNAELSENEIEENSLNN